MLRVFIGSSSEARKRGIVPKLVTLLGDSFTMRPWYDVFDQGSFTLEVLMRELNEIDLAILVFANDDERESRGQTHVVTRDNVVLEYGLFLGGLGRSRLWILKEEGVALPTDLSGLVYSNFRSRRDEQGNDSVLDADLQLRSQEIENRWRTQTSARQTRIEYDRGLGIAATVNSLRDDLTSTERQLGSYAESQSRSSKPISFDATGACLSTYAEALQLVESRFWTTTYMSSGFWSEGDARILHANANMMDRMRDNKGDVRRIFLLSQPMPQSVLAWKAEFMHLRNHGDSRLIEEFRSRFRNLQSSFELLLGRGCQIKVVYDITEHQRLPRQIDFRLGMSELAIYDNFRVDIFEGRSGVISNVTIYSAATRFFGGILQGAETYFGNLWERGEAGDVYLKRLEGNCTRMALGRKVAE